MASVRRWAARGLDVVAVLLVLAAVYALFVAPRLAMNRREPAPPVSIATLDGGRFDVRAHQGKLVFLDFWASWCEPCKLSIPLIQRYAAEHPDAQIVSVDVGESPAVVRAFVAHHPMQQVALDPDLVAAHAFGVDNFPTLVAIDPAGNVRAKWVGFNPAIGLVLDRARAQFGRKAGMLFAPAPAAAAELAPARAPQLVIEDEPSSLDTIRNTPFGWLLGPLTQGYLFLVDDRGELVPDRALALPTQANGGISADGKRITYRIRTGRWSDGAPFDARDVGFTIDALRNPNTTVPDTSAVADIASWNAPRPDTLVVRLRVPSAPFVASFLTLGANDPFAILPRHIAAAYRSLDASSLDTDPVGLGPFRLLRWERGQRLSFVRNPYYWRGPAASPRIDVAIVPDAQTRLVLARTGALDVTEVTGFGVDVARTIPTSRLVARTTNVADYLQFNLRSPALRELRTRQAIVAAIDRAKLAAAIYRGTLEPADSTQWDPRFRPSARLPALDPAAARAVLAPLHRSVELAIAGGWRNSASAAVQIAANLTAAGLTVRIHTYDEGTFWGPKDRGGILESGRYDLALTSWSPALDPDRSYLFGCAAMPPGGGNSMFYCDPAYDADEARGAAVYDAGARAPFYRQAGDRLIAGVPILPLGFERRTYVVTRALIGFRPNPLGRDYWNAWQFGVR
jgi:peptide/nickel transport system substrate-binding protein